VNVDRFFPKGYVMLKFKQLEPNNDLAKNIFICANPQNYFTFCDFLRFVGLRRS
jgi:hypothetical protein